MPAQRTRAAFAADQRSAHPGIAGVPPWAAVLIAVSATLAGFAFEAGSGHQELGFIFAAFYALGCLAAVLAVRHSGIFTTVIQPPLLLFVAVPLSYYLFHGSAFAGLKDVLITCGYPLIERFPLMLFTSAAVLVIGMSRWYFSMGRDASASEVPADDDGPVVAAQPSLFAGLAARFGAFTRPAADDAPRHGARSAGRSARPQKPRSERPRPDRPRPEGAERSAPTRPRHARPPRDDEYREDERRSAPRPRREPPRGSAREPDPRERPRRPRDSGRRTPPPSDRMRETREPRERTRDPREGREGYAPRPSRDSRFEPYPPQRRGSREGSRDPYDYPAEPPRRRPAPGDASSTHHPVSRVRYRGVGDPEDRPRR